MSAAITLWNKQMMKSLRNTEEMIGMLIQPVLWVVLFGVGMGSLLGPAMPGGDDFYISFMLPGIIALTASGGAIGGRVGMVDGTDPRYCQGIPGRAYSSSQHINGQCP